MLVCTALNCVMPARWRPVFHAVPAAHWPNKGAFIEPELCFCDVHKKTATLETLFSDVSRRKMDDQFISTRRVPPDWSRSSLKWVAVDPRGKSLWTYAVYHNPADFPGKYVVRRYASSQNFVFPQAVLAVEDTLEAAREKLPQGLGRIERDPNDDPAIVEVWL